MPGPASVTTCDTSEPYPCDDACTAGMPDIALNDVRVAVCRGATGKVRDFVSLGHGFRGNNTARDTQARAYVGMGACPAGVRSDRSKAACCVTRLLVGSATLFLTFDGAKLEYRKKNVIFAPPKVPTAFFQARPRWGHFQNLSLFRQSQPRRD